MPDDVKWLVLALGLGMAGAVAADLELRRRLGQHSELVANRQRAQRISDLTPTFGDNRGYRAAALTMPKPLPPPPRGPLLEGRRRLVVTVGAVVLTIAGAALALRPHPHVLHLPGAVGGLSRISDDQQSRLLQAQAVQQLDESSGLADPVVGRYGTTTVVAGARVLKGDGIADAKQQLAQVVGVSGLQPRSDGASCGALQDLDGNPGTACLVTGTGFVVGVLDLKAGATADQVAALARQALADATS